MDNNDNNPISCSDCSELFNNRSFQIPLYQRSYDWGYEEINQLLEDIKKVESNSPDYYYLGSLIVKENDNDNDKSLEVIDGQQRLTTLWLILLFLKKQLNNGISCTKDNLVFKSRRKSEETLEYLSTTLTEKERGNNDNKYDNKIIAAYNYIYDYFSSNDVAKQFKEKLKKTKIFIIPVPKYTDLNRYFETMNNRGIQLSQTDLVKAELLENLKEKGLSKICSVVWDACSNMDAYFQKSLDASKQEFSYNNEKVTARAFVFGKDWGNPDSFGTNLKSLKCIEIKQQEDKDEKQTDIWKQLLKDNNIANDENKAKNNNYDEEKEKLNDFHFKSIIPFEYFLLIVLKIYLSKNNHPENIKFDDSKLSSQFNYAIDQVKINVRDFFTFLVTIRYLFDHYIIKRTYTRNAKEEITGWGIIDCKKEDKDSYLNCSHLKDDKSNPVDLLEKIQSCLRVSFPGNQGNQIEWIYQILSFLTCCKTDKNCVFACMTERLENYARKKIKEHIDNKKQDKQQVFNQGTSTSHLLLNYLDYLIYKLVKENCEEIRNTIGIENPKSLNIDNFCFEYRNSVEHWYPQHPSNGTIDKFPPERGLNFIGNLCLLTSSENSTLSNLSPSEKSKYAIVNNGSLKLRIMKNKTETLKEPIEWLKNENNNVPFFEHGNKMISLLIEDINLSFKEYKFDIKDFNDSN
ncbi:DUF262 domain-containing protein [uncultured Succinivibrio sp.]|uniref:DUF262 domain-containing protein n=1 Tax=uncultured Succinivibrio sp. TaxID=540749 RepID=UPI0025DF2776|nr:DUF262 domain-containing protein [uncultured Succinivibrio sp.]